MKTKTKALFINQNGRVVCAEHGGAYLASFLERRPNADVIDTPLDNWVRLTAADLREFPHIGCEDC